MDKRKKKTTLPCSKTKLRICHIVTYLCLEFALDALELVVGVDVVAEGDSRVRGEGAQVAVVDLGVIYCHHPDSKCHKSIIIIIVIIHKYTGVFAIVQSPFIVIIVVGVGLQKYASSDPLPVGVSLACL